MIVELYTHRFELTESNPTFKIEDLYFYYKNFNTSIYFAVYKHEDKLKNYLFTLSKGVPLTTTEVFDFLENLTEWEVSLLIKHNVLPSSFDVLI